jgi:hypothetical protein
VQSVTTSQFELRNMYAINLEPHRRDSVTNYQLIFVLCNPCALWYRAALGPVRILPTRHCACEWKIINLLSSNLFFFFFTRRAASRKRPNGILVLTGKTYIILGKICKLFIVSSRDLLFPLVV